jgi:hypothetical protein
LPLKLTKPEKGSKRDPKKTPKWSKAGFGTSEDPRILRTLGPPLPLFDQNDHFLGPLFNPFFQNPYLYPYENDISKKTPKMRVQNDHFLDPFL